MNIILYLFNLLYLDVHTYFLFILLFHTFFTTFLELLERTKKLSI